jgi:hypothetical protein
MFTVPLTTISQMLQFCTHWWQDEHLISEKPPISALQFMQRTCTFMMKSLGSTKGRAPPQALMQSKLINFEIYNIQLCTYADV